MIPKNQRLYLAASAGLVGLIVAYAAYAALMRLYAQLILAGLIALYTAWILVVPAYRNLSLREGETRHRAGPSVRAKTIMAGAVIFVMVLGVGALEADRQYVQAAFVALLMAAAGASSLRSSILEPPRKKD